ncbi:hypothetical protein [Paenibacillus alginolyticus]|uniref:hypothetical protein n=1 Tax=Paenibacillus alginolyticus TaxID=59839 RepID=UPI00156429A7|nr:hypothetical protein [Paenibacillus frigoriresistens]
MGLGDYQLILSPAGNLPELNDMGMDFMGPCNFDFIYAVQILESVDCLRNYSPQAKWPSFEDACYYLYDNGKSKVEIELNAGTVAEKAEIISLRTNIWITEYDFRIYSEDKESYIIFTLEQYLHNRMPSLSCSIEVFDNASTPLTNSLSGGFELDPELFERLVDDFKKLTSVANLKSDIDFTSIKARKKIIKHS